MATGRQAFVTLAAGEGDLIGALVLGHSLRACQTTKELLVLVTDQIPGQHRILLSKVFDDLYEVSQLDLGGWRPDARNTLAKLHCWHLAQYDKCVFLDAACLVLNNCDELFDRSELSAVPDVGWPDCFNSGVLVLKPNLETFWGLVNLAKEHGTFDDGDQGLLNAYFGHDWQSDLSKRLSFVYNLVTSTTYTYSPAFRQFGGQSKIVHFQGDQKQWCMFMQNGQLQPRSRSYPEHGFAKLWIDIFLEHVEPSLMPPSNTAAVQAPVEAPSQQNHQSDSHPHSMETSGAISQHNEPPPTCEASTARHEYFKSFVASPITFQTPAPSTQPTFHVSTPASPMTFHVSKPASPMTFHVPTPASPKTFLPLSPAPVSYSQTPSYHPPTEPVIAEDKSESAGGSRAELASPPSASEYDNMRMRAWEEGRMDYMGTDSFDNIMKRLESLIVADEEVKDSSEMSSGDNAGDAACEMDQHGFDLEFGKDNDDGSIPGYPIGDFSGMVAWEEGRIDFTGKDSSDNIMRRLDFLIRSDVVVSSTPE